LKALQNIYREKSKIKKSAHVQYFSACIGMYLKDTVVLYKFASKVYYAGKIMTGKNVNINV